MASITVVSGPAEGDYYPLGERTLVIGRDEAVPIQVADELVSRKHAQLRWESSSKSYLVLDMKSANGTFINGRQIAEDLALADGDVIGVGNSRLVFSDQDFPDRESALEHYKKRGQREKNTMPG